jgi:hypothetical protein
MKKQSIQSPDDYRFPLTPDGTVEFTLDPRTGEEQVDLHLSSLESMARDAVDLAEPSHGADPTKVDAKRIEFGGTVIGAAAQPTFEQHVPELDLTHPDTLIAHGAWIVRGFRQTEIDDSNKAA